MTWVIHVPVWGERYHEMFRESGWPSIKAALEFAKIGGYKLVLSTDNYKLVLSTDKTNLTNATIFPVPNSLGPHRTLGDAHKQGIAFAKPGDRVVLLNADMIVSKELFIYLRYGFDHFPTRFVACPTIRCNTSVHHPIGASADELLDCAWSARHQFTSDCIWPTGKCKLPPYVFTETADSLVLHAFDLQPLALVRDNRDLLGPTASEIICNYHWDEIHIVDRNQVAIAETTARDLEYARFRSRKMNDRTITNWGLHFSYPNQQRTFTHQIVLRGKPNEEAQAQAERWSNHIAWGLHSGFMPQLERFQSKYWLAMSLPYSLRQLFPKRFREWVKTWEWWQ